jgi:hypothetical protein
MIEVLNDAQALKSRIDEELANGARILVERDGEVQELVLRGEPSISSAIRLPLHQGPREPFEPKIEILDEAKYEEIMSDSRR